MSLRYTYLALCVAAATTFALAEDAHHPADAKAKPPAAAKKAEPQKANIVPMHGMMKRMHEQMGQIHAATDPKEKERLMVEHMKTMDESMSMMNGMMKSRRQGGT